MTPAPLAPLLALRQHQRNGHRSPHKPLLALALAQLAANGSSRLVWSEAADRLADLVADFGPPSRTSATQSAAYPFTRLRSDGIWTLDRAVPMDRVGPLNEHPLAGRFTPEVEAALADSAVLVATTRAIVESEFPPTLVPDVLTAVGFDPDSVLGRGLAVSPTRDGGEVRRRSSAWPARVLAACGAAPDRRGGYCAGRCR